MKFAQPGLSQLMRDNVQEKILAMMAQKGLQRGDKLPTYRALCRQLNTSIVTVQRAMHDLARKGMVQLIHGKGVFVATPIASKHRELTRMGVVYRGSRHGMLIQPYLTQILMGLLDYADTWNADLNIFSLRAARGSLTPHLVTEVVDGVILLGIQSDEALEQYLRENVPMVVVDHVTHSLALDYVTCDNASAAVTSVEHLAGLGHRQVVYLADRPFDWDGQERHDAFLAAATEHGLQVHVLGAKATPELIRELQAHAPTAPTAIVTKDTQGARILLQALDAKGIAVPTQVSVAAVVGAAGDEYSGRHMITRGNVRFLEMGHKAAQLLQQRCQTRKPARRKIHRIPVELIPGTTTGKPRAKK